MILIGEAYVLLCVQISGVMIPLFSGTGTGIGVIAKRTGIGIAWNRFRSGIDSRAGIDSKAGIDSICGISSSTYTRATNYIVLTNSRIINRLLMHEA